MLTGAQNGTELAANITEQAWTAAQDSTSWYGPIGWATSTLSSAFSWASSCAYNLIKTPINLLGFMTLKRSTTTTRSPSDGNVKALTKHFTGMVYDKVLTPPLMALKYLAGPTLKGNAEAICQQFLAERESVRKPVTNALFEFSAWAYNLRGALELKEADIIFLEGVLKNRGTLDDLDNLVRLVELYQRFDKKVTAHRAKLSTLQSAADFTYLSQYSAIIHSPYKMPIMQGYSNAYQTMTCYYNGKKAEGREHLFNCLKDVGLATILTFLADSSLSSMEGSWAMTGLKIFIGVAISTKLHNKVFNPKSQLFLRKRHKLIDQYIDAIAHGRTDEVAEVLRQLIEDYQVDPDDIKLMSQVQEQDATFIKSKLRSSLLRGLEVLIKDIIQNPHAQSSRAGVVSYAQKLKTVCNLDPSNTQALMACLASTAQDEATTRAINTIVLFNSLDAIKEGLDRMIAEQPIAAQKDIELLLGQLKQIDGQTHAKYLKRYQAAQRQGKEEAQSLLEQRQIEIEQQLEKLLPKSIENQDAIAELLHGLKSINEKAFVYFQSIAIKAVERQMAEYAQLQSSKKDSQKQEKVDDLTLEEDLLALAPTSDALTPGYKRQQEGLRKRDVQSDQTTQTSSKEKKKKVVRFAL